MTEPPAESANPPERGALPAPSLQAAPPGTGLERYEATVHAADLSLTSGDAQGIAELDLDRVPDPAGGVRVLVDSSDVSRLMALGLEVRLLRAVPVQPLDPSLIATDDDVESWLSARITRSGEG